MSVTDMKTPKVVDLALTKEQEAAVVEALTTAARAMAFVGLDNDQVTLSFLNGALSRMTISRGPKELQSYFDNLGREIGKQMPVN